MKKNLIRLSILAISCLFCLISCKKDTNIDQLNQKAIIGSWTETPLDPQFNRTLYFGKDGSFTLHPTYFGTSTSGYTINGTYIISGNKLTITITEEIIKEISKPQVNHPVNYVLFDKATFTITGNKLLLDYLSYPADAPVKTSMKLIKN